MGWTLCENCGSQYLTGTVHNCLSMILSIFHEVQRVLIRRERFIKDLTRKYNELDSRHKRVKDHLRKAQMSGLITHYENLPLYCMSPEEESEMLINRLSEIATPQYKAAYYKYIRDNPS